MSRTTDKIREELKLVESMYKIEKQEKEEDYLLNSSRDNKYAFRFVKISAVIAIIIAVTTLCYIMSNIENIGLGIIIESVFSSLLSGVVSGGIVLIVSLIIYGIFFSKTSNYDGLSNVSQRMKEYYDKEDKIRGLELDLLCETIQGHVIRIKDYKYEWKNMILQINGEAREYYVSFPRDDDGYADVEYYEFVPKTNKD